MRRGVLLPLFCILAASAPAAVGEEKTAKPFGLPKRVPWTSKVVGSPEPPPPYRLKTIYPKLKFKGPVCIAEEPETGRLLVAENEGKILSFPGGDRNAEKPELFLDAKRQIYAFSFHPKYKENGYIFVFSPTPAAGSKDPQISRVSRYQTNLDHPRKVKPDSEKIIIEWTAGGHNGGEAIIGPDGYLYVCTGDGTGGSDVNDTGQGVNDLLSVMMRLDVERPDPGRNYSIPKDNPFVNVPGARPEIWAFGFRNPWRMSFDSETGRLWVGDVGQDIWEMIWVVQKGGNYGWSVQEGSHSFHPHKKTGPGPILPPVVEHHHTECRSITGGYVYHGEKFPELKGVYVYGDYQYGKIWGLRFDGKQVTWHKELADTAVFIASFAVTKNGDILAVDNSSGLINELERTPPGSATSGFPRRLSETGLFASVKDRKPAPGVVPYSVNAPGWADGASADRVFALPGDAQIGSPASWTYPDGMVIAQTLSLNLVEGDPKSSAPIETRMLVKQDEHWLGYSYLWNDSRTDAELVGMNGEERVLNVKDASAPGGSSRRTWRVPSRSDCMFCHSRAAGFVLGLNASQMNRDHDYGGGVDNQIRALDHAGYFKEPLKGKVEAISKYVDPYDEKADLEARARTYLHVNCSICHVSDGGGNSYIELALGNKLADTKLIDGKPVQGTFGIDDAKLVAPGAPERSVLFHRLSTLGGARMPRVGSAVPDDRALNLFEKWISSMSADPTPAAKAERARSLALIETLRSVPPAAPKARSEAIRDLTSTTSRASMLSWAIARSAFPETVRAEIVAATKEHPASEVRDLFERFVPESDRIRRLGDRVDLKLVLDLKGDASRGRAIFAAESVVNCKSCHRLDGVGVELGPDLSATKIGAKYSRADLLREIVEPSRTVEQKYALYRLETKSGLVYSGILVDKTDQAVILLDAKNQKIRVLADEIESLERETRSLMPDLLLRGLTARQAADLLEYLSMLK